MERRSPYGGDDRPPAPAPFLHQLLGTASAHRASLSSPPSAATPEFFTARHHNDVRQSEDSSWSPSSLRETFHGTGHVAGFSTETSVQQRSRQPTIHGFSATRDPGRAHREAHNFASGQRMDIRRPIIAREATISTSNPVSRVAVAGGNLYNDEGHNESDVPSYLSQYSRRVPSAVLSRLPDPVHPTHPAAHIAQLGRLVVNRSSHASAYDHLPDTYASRPIAKEEEQQPTFVSVQPSNSPPTAPPMASHRGEEDKETTPPVSPKTSPKTAPKNSPKRKKTKKGKRKAPSPKPDEMMSHERIPLSHMTLTSTKDETAARKLLKNATDLVGVLEEKAIQWLAESSWIFTVEQLAYVLSNDMEQLRRKLARGSLVRSVAVDTDPQGESKSFETTSMDMIEVPSTHSPNSDEQHQSVDGDTKPTAQSCVPSSEEDSRRMAAPLVADAPTLSNNQTKSSGLSRSGRETVATLESKPASSDAVVKGEAEQHSKPDVGTASEKSTKPEGASNAEEPSPETMAKANIVLDEWKRKIEECDQRGVESTDLDQKLYLGGALQVLVPRLVRLFLESINCKTAYDFLCLKKTESSSTIQVYRDWRAHCGLQSMKGFVLARHLLGIANRIEKGLSVPPVSDDNREWMKTSLIVLTGSAREFILNELGIRDVNSFIGERTKVWSDRLVKWRESQMMPVLKGSGKVAMVSGWKTTLKESLDCEIGEGKVLTEAELACSPPIEPAPEGPTFRLKGPPKPERAKIISDFKDADSALASPEFLAATLRPDNIKFLNSVGIRNASELIEAEKGLGNDIIAELVKHRTEATGSQAQPATCVRLLYDWTQRVRNKIGELQQSEPTLVRLAKKRGPKPKDAESLDKSGDDRDLKSTGSKDAKSVASTGKKRGPKAKIKQKDSRQREKITSEDDLLNVLSAITRGFLVSVNINSAKELLATKTSNLSKWYIDYREREGMTALKGYGAIATVSGWKTQIRKAANELGLNDLSATPIQHDTLAEHRAPAVVEKPVLRKSDAEYSSHINLLLGLPSHRFDVKDCIDPGTIYRFRLTVRNPLSKGTAKTSAEPCVYLTFLGAHSTPEAMRKTELPKTESGAPEGALPILVERSINPNDAETYRCKEDGIFFSSTMIGGGVIDIGKYAIGPVIGNMNYSDLQERIRLFFSLSGRSYPPAASQRGIEGPWNVFPRKTSDGEQYLLYVEHRIEKGQVIALRRATRPLTELPSYMGLDEEATLQERLTISRSISMLSPGYLKLMYDTISHIQSESVIRVLNKYGSDGNPLQEIPVHEAILLTTTRRRVQWLSTRILNQLSEIQGRLKRENQRQPKGLTVSKEVVETLLMEPANVRALRQPSYPHWETIVRTLEKEVKDEILACLGTAGSLRLPFDRRVWCKLSRDLLNECSQSVAALICGTGADPIGAQRRVVKEFCALLKHAANVLLNAKQHLSLLSFVPHPSEQETFHSGSSEDEGSAAKSDNKNDEVVAIDGAEVGSVVFETVAEVMAEDEDINVAWYIKNQLINCVHAVAMSGYVKWAVDPLKKSEPIYDKKRLEEAVSDGLGQKQIDSTTLTKSIRHRIAAVTSVEKKEFPSAPPVKHAEPSSLPFFLGIVWPTLRSHGWHVDAAVNPTDVIYVPPGQKLSRAKRALQRYAKKRQERGRKRRLVEQQVLSVGLGNVPKLTKRLVVQSSGDELSTHKPKSVKEALTAFERKLQEQVAEEDTESKAKLGTVISIIRKHVSELLPFLEEKDKDSMEIDEDTLDSTGSSKLMQLMTMLPGLLDQAGLPTQQIDTSMYVVKELLGFFTKHPVVPVTNEDYNDPPPVYYPFLAKKIEAITQGNGDEVEMDISDSNTGSPLSEIVMPEDEKLITPFAASALKQFIPCRATAADKRRGKPVPVGHPGFECRHCHATTGEGKFFFTGFDSLQTAAGVTWSHLTRCTMLDEELRLDLKKKREKHQAQRKALPYGSQSIFFRALWKRLNSSTFSASGRSVVLTSKTVASEIKGDPQAVDTKKGPNLLEFDNHIDVMLYIQKTELWKQKVDIREKISLYYSCLSDGGAMFNSSNLMTKHFSSEWILREKTKMGPIAEQQMLKRQLSTG